MKDELICSSFILHPSSFGGSMSVEIKIPAVGESITEGTIARWLKSNGAFVRANEPVCEVETDKATTEVMAPAGGRLTIGVKEGQKVAIGAVIGQIEEGAPPAAPPSMPPPSPAAKRDGNMQAPAAKPQSASEPLLSPAARPLAATEGIEPSQLTGSGRGGRIMKEDVLAHLQQRGERGRVRAPSAETLPSAETPRGADAAPL